MVRERSLRVPLFQKLFAVAAVCCLAIPAWADPGCPFITVDELGSMTFDTTPCGGHRATSTGVLAADPGPGGLASALTYSLLGLPSLVAGDVLLTEAGNPNVVFDIIRFNPAGTGGNPFYPPSLVFYSDNVGGSDALGDTPSPPTALYTNQVTIAEQGSEINNGAFYTPTAGQPGFIAGFTTTYDIISEGAGIPEPAWTALPGVLAMMLFAIWRRQRQRA